MSSTFFTTNDGDTILRAGPEPDSKHEFRVHKFILSLASSVFKDMFAFPQPPNRNRSKVRQLPIVDIPDLPSILDTILRLIYPGVEPPKIPDLPTLSAVLSAADKYNITSIYPVLRSTLKTLHGEPFRKYIMACRFGFVEEAKEAAKMGTTRSITSENFDEEVQHISTADLYRWIRFVQEREEQGRSKINEELDWWNMDWGTDCNHAEDGKEFYFRLEKAVADAFALNPCLGSNDLFAVLDTIPDPPPGCPPSPNAESGEFYYGACAMEEFKCQLRPMTIRGNLTQIAVELSRLNHTLLDKAFEKVIGGY